MYERYPAFAHSFPFVLVSALAAGAALALTATLKRLGNPELRLTALKPKVARSGPKELDCKGRITWAGYYPFPIYKRRSATEYCT